MNNPISKVMQGTNTVRVVCNFECSMSTKCDAGKKKYTRMNDYDEPRRKLRKIPINPIKAHAYGQNR